MAAVALIAVSVTGGAGIDRGAAAEPTDAIEVVGRLETPFERPTYVLGVDPVNRLMFATLMVTKQGGEPDTWLLTYDLRPDLPRLVGKRMVYTGGTTAAPNQMTSALDLGRNRVFFVATSVGKTGGNIVSFSLAPTPGPTTSFPVTTALPGFYPTGLTYSAADDRLYAVGEMAVDNVVHSSPATANRRPTGLVTTVAAFDPDDGSLLWWRHVPECPLPLYTLNLGSFIARSSAKAATPTLLFACTTSSAALFYSEQFPGQQGLAELRITPTAGPADAPDFDLRYHPISGTYFNGAAAGVAGYDYGADRFFLQSLALKTPVAWVFDARLGGWVGAITAPYNTNYYLGVNQATGRYYMGGVRPGGDGFFLVADGRATPPQNGIAFGKELAPTGFVFADPTSNRIVVPRDHRNLVLRDRSSPALPASPVDYDALTDDVPETPDTYVSFTGDAGGFGSRITAVGDTAGVGGITPTGSTLPAAGRGAVMARVPTANVQAAGASAAAQAASVDTTTGDAVERNAAWPHEPRTCLDGGGGVDSPPAESIGGRAEVRCSLVAYESVASARYTGQGLGPVSVGDSRFDTRVKRGPKDGMATVTKASSTGVGIEVPGVGSLVVGKVETVATSSAHGRSGTASASWTRTIEDVVVKDGAGRDLYRTKGCSTTVVHDGKKAVDSGDAGTCQEMAETIRRLLQTRVRLLFPEPAVVATPKGGFARVGQSEADAGREVTVNEQGKVFAGDATTRRALPALQIDVYNDATERSRYVVQLAAVENSSIYSVNRSADDAPCDVGGCIPGGFDGPPLSEQTGDEDPVDGSVDTASSSFDAASPVTEDSSSRSVGGGRRPPRSTGDTGLDGLVLARRSLGDGGLMASFLVLVAGAVGLVARRRRLLGVLGTR